MSLERGLWERRKIFTGREGMGLREGNEIYVSWRQKGHLISKDEDQQEGSWRGKKRKCRWDLPSRHSKAATNRLLPISYVYLCNTSYVEHCQWCVGAWGVIYASPIILYLIKSGGKKPPGFEDKQEGYFISKRLSLRSGLSCWSTCCANVKTWDQMPRNCTS